MSAWFRTVAAICAMTAGCGYWSTRPRGDVAPATWGATSPVTDTATSSAHADAIETRLSNLEHLRQEGIISADEYRERRRKVLANGFE